MKFYFYSNRFQINPARNFKSLFKLNPRLMTLESTYLHIACQMVVLHTIHSKDSESIQNRASGNKLKPHLILDYISALG